MYAQENKHEAVVALLPAAAKSAGRIGNGAPEAPVMS